MDASAERDLAAASQTTQHAGGDLAVGELQHGARAVDCDVAAIREIRGSCERAVVDRERVSEGNDDVAGECLCGTGAAGGNLSAIPQSELPGVDDDVAT